MFIQMKIVNPGWQVIHKMKLAKFVDCIGEKFFLTVGEAVEVFLAPVTVTVEK